MKSAIAARKCACYLTLNFSCGCSKSTGNDGGCYHQCCNHDDNNRYLATYKSTAFIFLHIVYHYRNNIVVTIINLAATFIGDYPLKA